MRLRTFLAVVILTPLLLAHGASPAAAHASELDATPAINATLDAAPAEVRITFDSPLLDTGAAVVVTGSDGDVISGPKPTIDDTVISVDLDPAAPAGTYTVAYRVVSSDGHTVTSSYEYTVTGGSTMAASPGSEPSPSVTSDAPVSALPSAPSVVDSPIAPSPSEPATTGEDSTSGLPWWIWAIGIVGVLALVIAVFGGRRR